MCDQVELGSKNLSEPPLTLPGVALFWLTLWQCWPHYCQVTGAAGGAPGPDQRTELPTEAEGNWQRASKKSFSLLGRYSLSSHTGWRIFVCLWLWWKRRACNWRNACQTDQWRGDAAAKVTQDMAWFNLSILPGGDWLSKLFNSNSFFI